MIAGFVLKIHIDAGRLEGISQLPVWHRDQKEQERDVQDIVY